MKLKDIREGWMNYFKSVSDSKNLPEKIKEMSTHRAEICKTCPELKPLLKGVKIGGPIKGRCGKCGCAFPQLVFAPGNVLWESGKKAYTRLVLVVFLVCG